MKKNNFKKWLTFAAVVCLGITALQAQVFNYTSTNGNYTEAAANDGSIDNTNAITTQFTGTTFNVPIGTTFVSGAALVVSGNVFIFTAQLVPAGLTANFEVLTATTGRIFFTGNATNHTTGASTTEMKFAFLGPNWPVGFNSETEVSVTVDGQTGTATMNTVKTLQVGFDFFTTLSVQENEIFNNLVLYPNPAKNMTMVNFGANLTNVTTKIYNLLGKVVTNVNVTTTTTNLTLNLNSLAAGTYILTLVSDQGTVNRRLIVE